MSLRLRGNISTPLDPRGSVLRALGIDVRNEVSISSPVLAAWGIGREGGFVRSQLRGQRAIHWFLVCVAVMLQLLAPDAGSCQETPADSIAADQAWRHDPYDLSQAAPVDSADVYASPNRNILLALPYYAWTALSRPIGELTVFAEQGELLARYFSLFTNAAGTLGIFPQAQFGGETGTGAGVRGFASNLFGRRKLLAASYLYSGGTGQMAEGIYFDPRLFGSKLTLRLDGAYLRTRNEGATINAAVEDDPTRRLELQHVDLRSTLGWRWNATRLAPYQRNLSIDAWFGYGRRDLRPYKGAITTLAHPGQTAEARLLRGLNNNLRFYRFGGRVAFDDRDYKAPSAAILLPLNYKIPGRVLTYADGLYHSFRDLGYPERGGLIAAELEFATGSDNVEFYRMSAEASRYITLFWPNRILALHAQVEKVSPSGNGFAPYTELPFLGGGDSARGYQRGFLRGQGALLFNVEYRYPIWDTWNAFLFWDEAQVFDRFDDIDRDGFRTSWGGGISIRTEAGLLGKLQIGHSAEEKALFGFTVGQAF